MLAPRRDLSADMGGCRLILICWGSFGEMKVTTWENGLLRLDERESYSLSFAKKAAAFFNTLRSTRNRRFSLRSRRSSSRFSLVKPVRPFCQRRKLHIHGG